MTYKLPFLVFLSLTIAACDGGGGVIRDGALTAPGLLLGERVALHGGVALLGAPASNEAVVFERGPDGWESIARLSPTQARVPDPFFGQFLDLDGDLAALGAPENDVALDAPGHVYVYARAGGAWTEEAVLRPSDLGPNANFGRGVSVSGGAVAVGAGDDQEDGRVHVFDRVEGEWNRTAVLAHPEPGPGRGFGGRVALDGGYLAVLGSAGRRDGRIFVFARNALGGWTLDDTLHEPIPDGSSGLLSFGTDLDLDGSTLVANGPGLLGGSVHIYNRLASGWALEATLFRSREELGGLSSFGSRIALSGDRVVASVPGREIDGELKGSAIVYVRSSDGT